MTHILVSVIVPGFNEEDNIDKTISSIAKQTLKEIEIIFIDDGSVDSTKNIVKKIMEKDQRVRLFENVTNMGRSYSRNLGILLCRGDYIMFCDADDILPATACEKLYGSAVKNNADLVRGGYRVFSNGIESDVLFGTTNSYNLTNNPVHVSLLGCFTSVFYRRKFLDNFQICFPLDMHIGEDNVFLAKCIYYASHINTINDVTYIYRHEDSGTMGKEWSENDFQSYSMMYNRIKAFWQPEAYYIFVSRNILFWIRNVFPKIIVSFRDEEQLKWVHTMLSTMELENAVYFKSSITILAKCPIFVFDAFRALKSNDIRSALTILKLYKG